MRFLVRRWSWGRRFERRERRRSGMWLAPMLFALVGLGLEAAMLSIGDLDDHPFELEFSNGAATSVLATIAGSMISVTGIVFSVLTLTVQYAGSAVSPRVVRTFYRDRVVKLSLGMFVGTFAYTIVLIPEIEAGKTDLAVTFAVLLAVASVGTFLIMVNHVGQGLRAASMIRRVAQATHRAIDDVHPRSFGRQEDDGVSTEVDVEHAGDEPIRVSHDGRAGVIMSVNFGGLKRTAARRGIGIELVPGVGDFVSPGADLFRIYGAQRINTTRLRGAIAFGEERSIDQDPAFGVRILADTAIKALSPGINDPTTAVVALDQLHGLLRDIGHRALPSDRPDTTSGFAFEAPTWDEYLDIALVEITHLGAGTFQIARRLRALIDDLQDALPDQRGAALDSHLVTLNRLTANQFVDPDDLAYAQTADPQGIGATSRRNDARRNRNGE